MCYPYSRHKKLASHRTFGINVPQVGKHETLKTAQSGHGCLDAVHGYSSEHSVKCDAVDAVFHQSQWVFKEQDFKECLRCKMLLHHSLGSRRREVDLVRA
jgi:hypothetical protein